MTRTNYTGPIRFNRKRCCSNCPQIVDLLGLMAQYLSMLLVSKHPKKEGKTKMRKTKRPQIRAEEKKMEDGGWWGKNSRPKEKKLKEVKMVVHDEYTTEHFCCEEGVE